MDLDIAETYRVDPQAFEQQKAQGEPTEMYVRPRLYMNGFPKAGLHLAVLMARTIEWEPAFEPPWVGTFGWNAWSTEWRPMAQVMAGLRQLRGGTFLKGHSGYRPEMEQFLYWSGAAVGFIYRDLRDVLVSMSYHVIAEDDEKFYHPAKEVYRPMGHEERLLACLNGIGWYAGLFERWELYAPWLNIPWVFPLRFEDMLNDRAGIVRRFVEYVYDRTTWGMVDAEIKEGTIEGLSKAAVHNMGLTGMSPTFRKGKIGQWREEFTPRVKDAFKEKAGDWLIRLGYEQDDAW